MNKTLFLLTTASLAMLWGAPPPLGKHRAPPPKSQAQRIHELELEMIKVKGRANSLEKELSALKKEYKDHWHETEHQTVPFSFHVKYNWNSIPSDAFIPYMQQKHVGQGGATKKGRTGAPKPPSPPK